MPGRPIQVELVGDAESLRRALGKATTSSDGFVKRVGIAFGLSLAAGKIAEGSEAVVERATDDERAAAQTEAVLASTGHAAGVTAQHVHDLAASLQDTTGFFSSAQVESAENLLLTFTNVKGDVFDRAVTATADMAAAMGGDMSGASIRLGKALNDPIKGASALRKVGVSLTESQKDQIKTLVESGETAKAQGIILDELAKEFGGSAAAQGRTFTGSLSKLKNALIDSGADVVRTVEPMLGRFVGKIVDALPEVRATVSTVLTRVKPALADVGHFVLDEIAPLLERLGLWVAGVVGSVVTTLDEHRGTISGIWHNLADAFGTVGRILREDLLPAVKFLLGTVLPKLLDVVLPVISKLSDAVAVWAAVLHRIYMPAAGAIRSLIGFLVDTIPDVFARAKAGVDAAVDFFKGFLDKINVWKRLAAIGTVTQGAIVGGGGNQSGNAALGQRLAGQLYGWGSGDQWAALFNLWTRESGWSNTADTRLSHAGGDTWTSTVFAYGIAQARPPYKMPRAGWPPDKGGQADPATQIIWGLGYIHSVYGTPVNAWAHSNAYGWYHQGGVVDETGWAMVRQGEVIIDPRSTRTVVVRDRHELITEERLVTLLHRAQMAAA